MRLPNPRRPAVLTLLALGVLAAPSLGAAPDGNVEWNGVSHVSWQDRRPLCPVSRESFQVRFQSYANDLTSAQLHVLDGGAVSWVPATKYGARGIYDLWMAQVPASVTDTLRYWIELTDGGDTDVLSANGMSDGAPADSGFLAPRDEARTGAAGGDLPGQRGERAGELRGRGIVHAAIVASISARRRNSGL